MMIFTHKKSFTCFMIKENFYRFYAVVTVRVFCVGHLAAQKKKNWWSEIKDLSVFTSNSFLKVLEHFRT